jgi:hypothetical protein
MMVIFSISRATLSACQLAQSIITNACRQSGVASATYCRCILSFPYLVLAKLKLHFALLLGIPHRINVRFEIAVA